MRKLLVVASVIAVTMSLSTLAEAQAQTYCETAYPNDLFGCAVRERTAYDNLKQRKVDPSVIRQCLALDLRSWELVDSCVRVEEVRQARGTTVTPAATATPPTPTPSSAPAAAGRGRLEGRIEELDAKVNVLSQRVDQLSANEPGSRPTAPPPGGLSEAP